MDKELIMAWIRIKPDLGMRHRMLVRKGRLGPLDEFEPSDRGLKGESQGVYVGDRNQVIINICAPAADVILSGSVRTIDLWMIRVFVSNARIWESPPEMKIWWCALE